MRSQRTSFLCLSLVASTLLATSVLSARPQSATERFTATAIDMDAGGTNRLTTDVVITVSRWSTDADRDVLTTALQEKGPADVLEKLKAMPRAGSIAGTASVGTDIQFARKIVAADKSERIILITDRPIGVWEKSYGGRSLDYPFTLIELRLRPDGKGEGKASIATKVMFEPSTKTIVLENYTSQPVALQNVVRQK